MFKRWLPEQDKFYSLFQQGADVLVEAAMQLPLLLKDLSNANIYAKSIKQQERQGDIIAHQAFDLLHKTFITPFDRNDIHAFIGKLDDILDLINHTAKLISLYQLTTLPDEITTLAYLNQGATLHLKTAIQYLNSLKHIDEILEAYDAIHIAKNTAGQTLLTGFDKLFKEENNFKQLLKVKEIYEHIHRVVEECEDLANIIKSMVLEYA